MDKRFEVFALYRKEIESEDIEAQRQKSRFHLLKSELSTDWYP